MKDSNGAVVAHLETAEELQLGIGALGFPAFPVAT
jgi:hypothetical protein